MQRKTGSNSSSFTADSTENGSGVTPHKINDNNNNNGKTFSPVSVVPQHQQDLPDRSSPHTFASGYDQEEWNRMGCATTSDDDDDEEDFAGAALRDVLGAS